MPGYLPAKQVRTYLHLEADCNNSLYNNNITGGGISLPIHFFKTKKMEKYLL